MEISRVKPSVITPTRAVFGGRLAGDIAEMGNPSVAPGGDDLETVLIKRFEHVDADRVV